MIPKHPDQLTNDELDTWIRRLVDSAEPEGTTLDYKQEIIFGSGSDRRELAKDVVSFANEIGGTLVYGIPENRVNPQAVPTPQRPYGIASIPGVTQRLEDIFAGAISPLLPEYRIREIQLSEYPGKVCYIVWTPESWIGPHMVHGYSDGRYYRRGQFRAVVMTERDVDERYRRRLSMRSAAEEFLNSEDARSLLRFYGRNQAKTIMMIVPSLLVPNRVAFSEPHLRAWLEENPLWRSWIPSMHGVRTFVTLEQGDKADVEVYRNGSIITCHYTQVGDMSGPPNIADIAELQELQERLRVAARFYQLLSYSGPLIVSIEILCPASYALFLPRHRKPSVPLEPSGTNLRIRIETAAAELVAQPNAVLKHLADRLFQAFGIWEADSIDSEGRFRDRR